jgi:synaptojanin
MHLYLREEPRALLLVTTTDDERLGTPPRALIFRATENQPSSQAVVEFLPKSEVDLNGVVRLTNRSVYGCLGIINVGNGEFPPFVLLF